MAKVGGYDGYESRAPSMAWGVGADTSQLAAFAEKLKQWPPAVNQAMVNAINDTLVQGRRKAAQLMVEKYNIKQKDIIDAVKMHKAYRNQETFFGKLTIHPSRRPGLAKFESAQTEKGVTYRTLKGAAKRLIPGAYQYPKAKGKAAWVAIRPNPKNRNHVKFLQGISVWGMFASLNNREKVNERMAETFMDNLAQQVNFQFLARTNQIAGVKTDRQGWIRRSGKRPIN